MPSPQQEMFRTKAKELVSSILAAATELAAKPSVEGERPILVIDNGMFSAEPRQALDIVKLAKSAIDANGLINRPFFNNSETDPNAGVFMGGLTAGFDDVASQNNIVNLGETTLSVGMGRLHAEEVKDQTYSISLLDGLGSNPAFRVVFSSAAAMRTFIDNAPAILADIDKAQVGVSQQQR